MSGDLRPPRRFGPLPEPDGPLLPAPPAAPDLSSQQSVAQPLMMTAGMLGGLIFFVINPNPLFIVAGILFAGASVASGLTMGLGQRRRAGRSRERERERYLDRLDELLAPVPDRQQAESELCAAVHPAPEFLTGMVAGPRLFERRRSDSDFLRLRIGEGTVSSSAAPRPPVSIPQPADQVCGTVLDEALARYRELPGPVSVSLDSSRVLHLDGCDDRIAALARAMVLQLVSWHQPRDVRLLVACAPEHAAQWRWVRWLPHQLGDRRGAAVLTSAEELTRLLTPQVLLRDRAREVGAPAEAEPHLVVVADGILPDPDSAVALLAQPGITGLTLIAVARDEAAPRPRWSDLRLALDSAGLPELTAGTDPTPAGRPSADGVRLERPDLAGAGLCESVARTIAGSCARSDAAGQDRADDGDLAKLLGLPDLTAAGPADRERLWQPRPPADILRTPIGRSAEGAPVWLDLKESAAGGIGPHGLVVGATGSGKSELLRTLVTGLALQHAPEQLSFVLADFKGGAAFAGLAALPHTAGVITNLADDEAMVDRMHQALFGEQQRRQELLRDAGNLNSVAEYQALRAGGAELEPLPHLLVVVDEFSELLVSRPDFADLFASIGRLGRSLGMHLLLASQRLDEGRLRGLESHISYRIALRTFSSQDSTAVLGVPDAYRLPDEPGWAYLKAGTSVFQRFRTISSSEAIRVDRADDEQQSDQRAATLLEIRTPQGAPLLTGTSDGSAAGADTAADADIARPSVSEATVALLLDEARQAHQVWLAPLPGLIQLGGLLGELAVVPGRGLAVAGWPAEGQLAVPIGVLDLPREQRYELALLDLAGHSGSVQVLGAPQTGKSALLRSLALGLALTHTPEEVQLYCLDFGGALAELAELPHVGAVVPRSEPERVERTVAYLLRLLDERAAAFVEHEVTSMSQARLLRAPAAGPGASLGSFPDVFLLVDGMLDVRNHPGELEADITDLAARGLSYGVHVVLTTTRPADCRPAIRDVISSRIELRLGEPADSLIDRASSRTLAGSPTGRAMVAPGAFVQLAMPTVALPGESTAASLRAVAEASAEHWSGIVAPPVRLLPRQLQLAELPAPGSDERPGVPVGIGDSDLQAAYLDLTGHEPHLVVLGDAESGKTSLLTTVLTGLVERATPQQAQVYVVDYRRSLLDVVPRDYLAGYAVAAPAASELVSELVELLGQRLPGAELTASELRSRSWWSGPEIFLVVEDYDLLETATPNPLAPIADYLANARDIGLHVVLSRRCAGTSRAIFMPLLARLKDFGSSAVLLSGDPAEGALFGDTRPARQPVGRGLLVRPRRPTERVQFAEPPPVADVLTSRPADSYLELKGNQR